MPLYYVSIAVATPDTEPSGAGFVGAYVQNHPHPAAAAQAALDLASNHPLFDDSAQALCAEVGAGSPPIPADLLGKLLTIDDVARIDTPMLVDDWENEHGPLPIEHCRTFEIDEILGRATRRGQG